MIILIDAEKPSEKSQHPVIIFALSKVGNKDFPNLKKVEKPVMLCGSRMNNIVIAIVKFYFKTQLTLEQHRRELGAPTPHAAKYPSIAIKSLLLNRSFTNNMNS